jgi:hypothetical protein
MPPQQCERLLDFIDERLDFGAQLIPPRAKP